MLELLGHILNDRSWIENSLIYTHLILFKNPYWMSKSIMHSSFIGLVYGEMFQENLYLSIFFMGKMQMFQLPQHIYNDKMQMRFYVGCFN